jgi:hypothetical protein
MRLRGSYRTGMMVVVVVMMMMMTPYPNLSSNQTSISLIAPRFAHVYLLTLPKVPPAQGQAAQRPSEPQLQDAMDKFQQNSTVSPGERQRVMSQTAFAMSHGYSYRHIS